MNENLLQTLQQLVQDVIAPDVRKLKVRMASLEKQNETNFGAVEKRFSSIEQRFTAIEKQMDAQFRAIMAAISESKAQSELAGVRMYAALSERVAVLESQRHQ